MWDVCLSEQVGIRTKEWKLKKVKQVETLTMEVTKEEKIHRNAEKRGWNGLQIYGNKLYEFNDQTPSGKKDSCIYI